jgi:hypothetical protein
MTRCGRAFHRHARFVVDHELRRAGGRLTSLPHAQRLAVEEVSARVAASLVDGVLDCARVDPVLAEALASIYGPEPEWEPRAVSCTPD